MGGHAITLEARWGARAESAEACAERLAVMLNGLAAAHPAFGTWCRGAPPGTVELPWCSMPPRLRELTRIFRKGQNFKDIPREPWPELGYLVGAYNAHEDALEVDLEIHAGCSSNHSLIPNSVKLELAAPMPGNADLINSRCLKEVLRSVVASWEPAWASAFSSNYTRRLHGPGERPPQFRSGWMTYLSSWYARQVTPPSQAVTEAMPGGGLLMLATEEPFSAKNPGHVAVADAFQAALAPIQGLGPLRA